MLTKNKKSDNKMANHQETDPNSRNLIGKGTTITGELSSDGVIRLDGTIKGNLTTKAKLVVGESGAIFGDVRCQNADISGKVEGKLIVGELLTLKASSKVKGEIYTKQLSIEPDAKFDGTCDMSGNAPRPKSSEAGDKYQTTTAQTASGQTKDMNDKKQTREKS